MTTVLDTVRSIDTALRFPEHSPVGRALVDRADRNRDAIKALRGDVDALEVVVTELKGVVKALRFVGLLVGIVLSILTLIQVVNPS